MGPTVIPAGDEACREAATREPTVALLHTLLILRSPSVCFLRAHFDAPS